jgi:putative ATP-dependent endonuclease of OLD family
MAGKMTFIRAKIEAKNIAPSARASKAIGFQKNNLKTVTAEVTFEYELMISGNNIDLISDLYATMHRGTTFLDKTHSKEERAREILIFLNNFKDKSELAQQIAHNIENDPTWNGFVTPQYIIDGITWLIDG